MLTSLNSDHKIGWLKWKLQSVGFASGTAGFRNSNVTVMKPLSVCLSSFHLGPSLPLYGTLFSGRISKVTKVESAVPCFITTISTALVESLSLLKFPEKILDWISKEQSVSSDSCRWWQCPRDWGYIEWLWLDYALDYGSAWGEGFRSISTTHIKNKEMLISQKEPKVFLLERTNQQ